MMLNNFTELEPNDRKTKPGFITETFDKETKRVKFVLQNMLYLFAIQFLGNDKGSVFYLSGPALYNHLKISKVLSPNSNIYIPEINFDVACHIKQLAMSTNINDKIKVLHGDYFKAFRFIEDKINDKISFIDLDLMNSARTMIEVDGDLQKIEKMFQSSILSNRVVFLFTHSLRRHGNDSCEHKMLQNINDITNFNGFKTVNFLDGSYNIFKSTKIKQRNKICRIPLQKNYNTYFINYWSPPPMRTIVKFLERN